MAGVQTWLEGQAERLPALLNPGSKMVVAWRELWEQTVRLSVTLVQTSATQRTVSWLRENMERVLALSRRAFARLFQVLETWKPATVSVFPYIYPYLYYLIGLTITVSISLGLPPLVLYHIYWEVWIAMWDDPAEWLEWKSDTEMTSSVFLFVLLMSLWSFVK